MVSFLHRYTECDILQATKILARNSHEEEIVISAILAAYWHMPSKHL